MINSFNIFVLCFHFCNYSNDCFDYSFDIPLAARLKSTNVSKYIQFDWSKLFFKAISLNILVDDFMSRFFSNLYVTCISNSLIYVYDLTKIGFFLLTYLKKNNKKNSDITIIIKNNIIYKISFWLNNNYYTLLDFNLLLPVDVSSAALSFNTFYFFKSYFINNFNFNAFFNNMQLRNLLYHAVINYSDAFLELIIQYNSFMLHVFNLSILNQITLYSFNFELFQTVYLPKKIINLDTVSDLFIRDSYTGGICDVYKPFGVDLVWLDFISMYPSVMKSIRVGLNSPSWTMSIEDLGDFCKRYPCFIKVKVKCSIDMKFPLISVRCPSTNKIIQATGEFIVTVWGNEILYCLEHYKQYYQFEVLNALYFTESSTEVFSDYVSDLFNLRSFYKNVDINKSLIFKLMLNSLSGRLGISFDKAESKILNSDEELSFVEGSDIIYKNTLKLTDDLVLLNYNDLNFKLINSRVDWASAITSEARILIQKLKDIVDIYYVDTDAIVIKSADLVKISQFIDKDKLFSLGKLKIIYLCAFCVFVAPKTYVLGIQSLNNYYTINSIRAGKFNASNLMTSFFYKLHLSPFFLPNDIFMDFYMEVNQLNIAYDKRLKFYQNDIWVDTFSINI